MTEIETTAVAPVKVRKQRTPKVPKVPKAPKAPKVPKEKKQRVGIEHHRKDGKPTAVSVILDVLQMKTIKNKELAVAKVMEKMPGSDKKKVESQLAVTLHMLKHGKGRMAKFTWDPATYTLTPKL